MLEGLQTEAGKSFAVDLGTYYQSKTFEISGYDSQWALGLNISNIGSKISYTESGDEDFLPMNLRLGSRISMEIDDYNEIMFAFDINKLLVPTPPVYAIDSDGQPVDINGNPVQLGSPEAPYSSWTKSKCRNCSRNFSIFFRCARWFRRRNK